MHEEFIIKCSIGQNAGKFVYRVLANNGGAVWASDIDNSKRFDLKEEAELFALDKDIVCYEIITIAVHSKRKK